ncbi:hypothetical protein N7490_006068 [Penicillium lividum]|nr:hypothetical protein N7490_006068 [Penicillium lividum]
MTDANINTAAWRGKVVGSLNSAQHEFDILLQIYETLRDHTRETETELKKAQEKIKVLQEGNDGHLARATVISVGDTTDEWVRERLTKIYDDLDTWTTSVPLSSDFAIKWPAAIGYLKDHDFIDVATQAFDDAIPSAEPELISAGIISIIAKDLFLGIVAGATQTQRDALGQLHSNIPLIEPQQTVRSVRTFRVEMVRAWVQSSNYQSQLDQACEATWVTITNFLQTLGNITSKVWQRRLLELKEHIVVPAGELATEMQCSGARYEWNWHRIRPDADLNELDEFEIVDYNTRYRLKHEMTKNLPRDTKLGEHILVIMPSVERMDWGTGEVALIVKNRVLVRINQNIRLRPRDSEYGLFKGPSPTGKSLMES